MSLAVWNGEAVREVKQAPGCKLCKTPRRVEVDLLLLMRSKRAVLEDGTRVTEEYVKARLVEMGVENPTKENLTGHWKNHCEVVDAAEEQAIEDAVDSAMAALTPEQIAEMSSMERIDVLEQQVFLEIQAKLKRTGTTGMTVDQLLRIVELKQKQRQNEDQRKFLGALGAGIAGALQQAKAPAALPPAHPVLEAEVVEEGVLG